MAHHGDTTMKDPDTHHHSQVNEKGSDTAPVTLELNPETKESHHA